VADAGGRQRCLNILVVAPAWVGDMVLCGSLIKALTARYPGALVYLVAPPTTAPLGARLPGVTATHVLDAGHGELALAARWRIGRRLVAERFDLAIVLPSSFKSALVPFWARVPRRRGYTGELRYGVLNERRALDAARLPRAVDRFVALAGEPGEADAVVAELAAPVLAVDADNAARLAAAHGLDSERGVALCPGAEYGPAKRWPATHFAALARLLVAAEKQVWLLGGPNDVAVCAEIEGDVPRGIVNLAGATSLVDAVDVLSLARHVVTNDSGLMHVACAVGRPVTAIYGASSPHFTPPLAPDATVVRRDLPCSPCFHRDCPLGHRACLVGLPPERVAATLALGAA